jgi:hypothetical protein
MAHTCNPSYSGGRDQEDHSSKAVQANSCKTLSWKNPSQKRTGKVAQGVGSEFNTSVPPPKKKKTRMAKVTFYKNNNQ